MRAIVGDQCVGSRHRFAHPRGAGDTCHCGAYRMCNQGHHAKPIAAFGTRLKNCTACATKYAGGRYGERASRPRRGLRSSGEHRFIFAATSGNQKLGPIPAVIVSPETCPPSCGFYGRGCYAEFGVSGFHWRRTAREGLSFHELVMRVGVLPWGQLWRYGVAGDLPGIGDELDIERLGTLVNANYRKRGFTFTHKPLSMPAERRAVAEANAKGFTINLSADTLEQADERAALGIGPVAVVLPSDAGGDIRTPEGRRVVVCPAESRGLSCSECGLCARAERRGIVGFRAHGQMQKTVSAIADGKRRLPLVPGQVAA